MSDTQREPDSNSSGGNRLIARLVSLTLQRRVGVLVLFLSMLVVGFVATRGIPLELFPRGYVGKSLNVSVPWPNSPTREVLEKITIPLEDELSTVKGLDRLNSFTRVGSANVNLAFKQNTDMDVAYREVRDRVQRARLTFPDDVDRFYISKEDPSGIPVAFVGVTIPEDVTDYYNLIQDRIVTPLSRIDGVARVTVNGLQDKEILIDIDRARAEASGLNLYEVAQELRGDNFTMASGFVNDNGSRLALRSVAEYRTIDDLRNRPLNRNTEVEDIGVVRYDLPEREFSVRVNSEDAFAFGVIKEGEANTVETSRRVKERVAELQKDPALKGVMIEIFFNQGEVVELSLGNLVESGVIGGVLAAMVLFFFLKRVRLTVIISLSIPTSLMVALIAMYFYGETLNILTILALVICVGLLVDNSVVVAENIYRLIDAGMDHREACIHGASEIALAVTMATLTTIIVFLPVSLVGGEAQFFLTKLSIPITVALVGSLVVALLFIPLTVYLTIGRVRRRHAMEEEKHTRFSRLSDLRHRFMDRLYQATFGQIGIFYSRMLRVFLVNRLALVLCLAAVFGVTGAIVFKEVKVVPAQEEDQTSFTIGVQMSSEYSFEDTAAYYATAEKILEEKAPDIGLKGYMMVHFTGGGNIQGWMDENRELEITAKEAMSRLGDALPRQPGVRLFYGQENNDQKNREAAVYVMQFFGEDAEELKVLTDRLEPVLEKLPGVIGVRYREQQSPNELALVMNREKLSSTGVQPELVAGVINYALQGQLLSRYNMDGHEVPIRAQFQKEDRETLASLLSFQIPAPEEGGTLPLSALTTPRFEQTPTTVFRDNRRISRTITLDLEPENAEATRGRIEQFQKTIDLPEGVSFENPNQSIPIDDIRNLMMAAGISIIFIYLLMSFLFESFILPLSIVLTIPLASLGVYWGHYIADRNLDVLGCIGGILLIGVVVNNGIVLIDYVNRLRLAGNSRDEALMMASERRFRPIAMTALTTIIGMIPLTVSQANATIGISYKSFGITLIGGMTTATVLTLLVVPVFYTFFDDASRGLRGLMQRIPRRAAAESVPDPAGRPA